MSGVLTAVGNLSGVGSLAEVGTLSLVLVTATSVAVASTGVTATVGSVTGPNVATVVASGGLVGDCDGSVASWVAGAG